MECVAYLMFQQGLGNMMGSETLDLCMIQEQIGQLETDVFIPSRWAGNYTCVSDDVLVNFTLSVTKSSIDQMDLDGAMYINNELISTTGSYASAFRILTFQSNDVIQQDIFGGNITNVELNGRLRSPVFIDGVIVFNDENGRFYCPMELRRVQVLVQTSWCNGHGKCHRYGSKRDQYRCCCDPGFAGDTCLTRITPSTTVTSAVKTTAVTPMASTIATSTSTTTDTTGSTSVQGLKLENAIHPGCTSYGWNIYVDMSILKHLNPTMSSSHVYFGDTSCRGRLNGTVLIFQQGFRDCLTSERVSNDTFIYDNDLFYATYDPIYPFIIRQHNWTFTVECDVSRSEATAFHVHHVVDSHLAAVMGHYNISTSFFKDANFMEQISGNPVNSGIGANIYVKMFTTVDDWTIKMRLDTCYTKPYDAADDKHTYFLIKDGCEVDSTTHILSQTTHETKFVFQNFEYSTDREGINVFCNATFCETTDDSARCTQPCH